MEESYRARGGTMEKQNNNNRHKKEEEEKKLVFIHDDANRGAGERLAPISNGPMNTQQQ